MATDSFIGSLERQRKENFPMGEALGREPGYPHRLKENWLRLRGVWLILESCSGDQRKAIGKSGTRRFAVEAY